MFIDEWCRDARGWRSLHQFKVGVGHDEPFRAGRLEINLYPRVGAAAFIVKHDALAELAVARGSGVESARLAFAEDRQQLEVLEHVEVLWTLHRASGDAHELSEAWRLLEDFVGRLPPDARSGALDNVPLYAGVRAAYDELSS